MGRGKETPICESGPAWFFSAWRKGVANCPTTKRKASVWRTDRRFSHTHSTHTHTHTHTHTNAHMHTHTHTHTQQKTWQPHYFRRRLSPLSACQGNRKLETAESEVTSERGSRSICRLRSWARGRGDAPRSSVRTNPRWEWTYPAAKLNFNATCQTKKNSSRDAEFGNSESMQKGKENIVPDGAQLNSQINFFSGGGRPWIRSRFLFHWQLRLCVLYTRAPSPPPPRPPGEGGGCDTHTAAQHLSVEGGTFTPDGGCHAFKFAPSPPNVSRASKDGF